MAPRLISPRAAQKPWDTEEQWGNDEGNDGYVGDYDGNYDAEWDSEGDAAGGEWESSGERALTSGDVEEVSGQATEEPETKEPEPVLEDEASGNTSTFPVNEEASPANMEDDSIVNPDSFEADNTLEQADQEHKDEPVDPQVPQEEEPKLTPEEQAIKDREGWQIAVASRKERLRKAQMAKNDSARKMFDIFQKGRKEEKLNAAKKVVPVKSGQYRGRINRRGLAGELGKKVVGKVADVLAEKLAEKLAGKKIDGEKEKNETDEAPVVESSSGPIDYSFMDNLMNAVKGSNVPVMEGLPGLTSYDEDAPTSPEDPRRIHRVLKVVLGRELFEELSDLSLETYEAQDQAVREELMNKVLFAVKKNPDTEKIKIELLEGLPGLGDCGLALPLRSPPAKTVDPCELAELCAPDIPCAAADLCRKANALKADEDITPEITVTEIASGDAQHKVSPILTLIRLFRAAKVSKRPKLKSHEEFHEIEQRDVGEFEGYMADLTNACSFNMPGVRKPVLGAPRKLSPNFKTVEHNITVAGATGKPHEHDEKEEGAEDDWDEGDDEDDWDEGDDENEHEDSQDLGGGSNESPAKEDDNNAAAIEDSEAIPPSDKTIARNGNHYGWFPSTAYPRSVAPADEVPVVADAPAVLLANMAPTEPIAPSTLGEDAVDKLIAEAVVVASLGPAMPPSTTPASVLATTKTTPTKGVIGGSASVVTQSNEMVSETVQSNPEDTISKEDLAWEKRRSQRARRIRKERKARARFLRNIKHFKEIEEKRARKAAGHAASLGKNNNKPSTLPQHSKRASPSQLEAHAPVRTEQGVKEEEQRWHAGEGRVSDADREEAIKEIAKVAKLRESERQKSVEVAAAKAAAQDDEVGNQYLDHNSYDPAQAHVQEAAEAVRFPAYKGIGDSTPQLGTVGFGVVILIWIALMVTILRCQRHRGGGSPNWASEHRGRGFLRRGRKNRQSGEQGREKLDV